MRGPSERGRGHGARPRARRRGALVAVAAVGLSAAALAQPFTGRVLLESCRAAVDTPAGEPCAGWSDWVTMSPYFCLPDDLDRAVVSDMLVEWLSGHPEKLHMPGGALVQEAFYERYPCPRPAP